MMVMVDHPSGGTPDRRRLSLREELELFFKSRTDLLQSVLDKISDIPRESLETKLAEVSSLLKENYVQFLNLIKTTDKQFACAFDSYVQGSFPSPLLGFEAEIPEELPIKDTTDASLLRLLIMHFYRRGYYELACQLEVESLPLICNPVVDLHTKDKFKTLSFICKSLEMEPEPQLEPLLSWIESASPEDDPTLRSILFDAHALQFSYHMFTQNYDAALAFCSQSLSQFTESAFLPQVKHLVSSFVFPSRLVPLTVQTKQLKCKLLEAFSASIVNLPSFDSFQECLKLGISNLPLILKFTERIVDTRGPIPSSLGSTFLSQAYPGTINSWRFLPDLPVDIQIPGFLRFHSVFTCPVSKQTSNSANPPMRITCGHVLSKEAIHKLSRGFSIKFKCPYCPLDCEPSHSMILHI